MATLSTSSIQSPSRSGYSTRGGSPSKVDSHIIALRPGQATVKAISRNNRASQTDRQNDRRRDID